MDEAADLITPCLHGIEDDGVFFGDDDGPVKPSKSVLARSSWMSSSSVDTCHLPGQDC